MLGHIPEGLHYDGSLLLQVMGVEFLKATYGLYRFCGRHLRIIRCVLCDLEAGLIGHIVLQHIKDKSLFYGLPHGVDMERMEGSVLIFVSKQLQGLIFRCGCKCEEA